MTTVYNQRNIDEGDERSFNVVSYDLDQLAPQMREMNLICSSNAYSEVNQLHEYEAKMKMPGFKSGSQGQS